MKKNLLSAIVYFLLLIIFVPFLAKAGIVTCDTNCGINELFAMLGKIVDIIVKQIATPLATIAVIVGGILMMVSAGNPNLMSLGKKVFWSAIIGLILAWCSYLIIDTILKAIGVSGGLSSFSVGS